MVANVTAAGWAGIAAVAGLAYGAGWLAGRRRPPAAPLRDARPSPRGADAPPSRPPSATTAQTAAATAGWSPEPSRVASAAPSVAGAVAPGRTTLGRYRIERPIGSGSMGMVYLGHDPQGGRAVALKTLALSREFEGSALTEARARFFREAEMAGRLQHLDIVTIFEAGEQDGLAYLAMEYVNGRDLSQHTLAGRLLPVTQVLRTLARVALALAHAHAQGVVHRDVKPANVMIDPASDVVKVTDFGVARIADACQTRTGLVLGTPSFMSPEQMAGRRLDGRTDLYSLGVMLFQMLTGVLPHRSDSMAQLMSQIANEPAPDIRTLRPELPEALANVVALALEKRPEIRYADGHQMAADLLAVAQALDPSPEPPIEPGADATPQTTGFEATVEFSRADPRHNVGH